VAIILTSDEARTSYEELLEKLRDTGGSELASEIERIVGTGRVQERERHLVFQEQLPPTSALEIALRMLAAWIEPVFLVSEAERLLREATGAQFDGIVWRADRLDVVQAEGPAATPRSADESLVAVPQLGASLDEVRRHIERLHALAAEISGAETA
jgi:hypothetical protein